MGAGHRARPCAVSGTMGWYHEKQQIRTAVVRVVVVLLHGSICQAVLSCLAVGCTVLLLLLRSAQYLQLSTLPLLA